MGKLKNKEKGVMSKKMTEKYIESFRSNYKDLSTAKPVIDNAQIDLDQHIQQILDKVYCVLRRLKNARSPFNAIVNKHTNDEIKSCAFVSFDTQELFVEEIENLRRVFFYQWTIYPQNGIISTLKSGHLFN
jgi:hypothetical protein